MSSPTGSGLRRQPLFLPSSPTPPLLSLSPSVSFPVTPLFSPTHEAIMTRPTFDHWQIGRILSSFFSPSLCVYLCLHVPFVLLRRQYIRVYEQSFASASVNSFSFFNAFLQKQNNERVLSLCLSLVSLVRYTERHNCKFVSSLYLRFLTVTLRCPPFSVSSFSSCIRFLLISHVCTEIEFPRGRRWRGSARRRKNVGCAHSCDHGTS